MTKKECYEAMYRIWSLLANDPELTKWEIPEAKKHVGKCPACTYTVLYKDSKSSCELTCIMKSLWPNGCSHISSPYWRYKESEGYDKCFFAAVIAEEAKLLGESC